MQKSSYVQFIIGLFSLILFSFLAIQTHADTTVLELSNEEKHCIDLYCQEVPFLGRKCYTQCKTWQTYHCTGSNSYKYISHREPGNDGETPRTCPESSTCEMIPNTSKNDTVDDGDGIRCVKKTPPPPTATPTPNPISETICADCFRQGKTCTAYSFTDNSSLCVNKRQIGVGGICKVPAGWANNEACQTGYCDPATLKCATQPTGDEATSPVTPDTCTTIGNSTIGNQREYECQASCGNGRVQYSDRNSSCTSGICCRLVATDGITTPPPPTVPTPPSEVGYCADDDRSNPQPINGAACGINNAEWVDRSNGTGSGYDPYCDSTYGNAAEYFYKCPAGGTPAPTVTATPTPTPYTPSPEGGNCNPLQGTWQCEGGSYCSQACSSSSASCTTGRCCTYGKSWNGSACVADPTPTTPPAVPSGSPATPTPTPAAPIDTGSACPDVNPGTNPPVFNVCRPSAPGCLTSEGETPKANQAAHDTCSNFYGGSYLCCQRAPAATAAGSSCNLSPRKCDTSKNNSTGTNIQCTGCGGYCVPDSTGQGICMNQYY